MKKIRFRAKRLDENRFCYGVPTYQYDINWDEKNSDMPDRIWYMLDDYLDLIEIDETTISQFTTFKDKNGVDVYENDICSVGYFKNAIVVFWEYGWHFESAKDTHHSFRTAMHTIEVVGNTQDNPELLSTPTAVL